MQSDVFGKACLSAMLIGVLVFYLFEHAVPGWVHELAGLLLVCSVAAFLAWFATCCLVERLRRH